MKALFIRLSILGIITCGLACCTSGPSNQQENATGTENENIATTTIKTNDFEDSFDSVSKGLPIFYNMYLTVDMSTMFETVGADFDPSLLNPSDNSENYIISSKKALNLGVYSVDLIYTKLYGKTEASTQYFNSMSALASGLRIPETHFNNVMERFEKNVSNKDSVYAIANDVYVSTDQYLKENDRESASALILLGGWIEAMYLASEVYEKEGKDLGILDRFADQKHSLEIIIGLLKENTDDDTVNSYLKSLVPLSEKFKTFTIDYDNPDNSYKPFTKIKKDITNIREKIIG